MTSWQITKIFGLYLLLASIFTLSVVAQGQQAAVPSADVPLPEGVRVGKKGVIHLDFTDVEIREVVKAISQITGKNFVMDDRVRGKITIISPEPVSIDEAYQAFVSALEVKNFTTVTEGKVTKIIPLREAKSSPIPSDPSAAIPFGASFITRLIPIRYISANEIALSLKSLVSSNGSITAYGPTNSLIVTDSASNIRRLMKIINKLDRRGFQEGIEVVPLTYATAPQMAKMLIDLFQVGNKKAEVAKRSRRTRGSQDIEGGQLISKIIPDERTNSLIVIANREGIEKVLNIVRRLDHEIEVEEGRGRIHVHYLEHADSEELAQTLSGLTSSSGSSSSRRTSSRLPARPRTTSTTGTSSTTSAQSPGTLELFDGEVKIAADVATNSLVITASPQDYESLRPIIKKLDIRRRQVFVEAIILEVNINKALDVGLEAHGGHGAGSNNENLLFGASSLGGPLNALTLSTESLGAAGAAAGGVFGFRSREIDIPGFGTIPVYGAIFRALQSDSIVNVLSTPNILTTDNKPAEILVGSNVPILVSNQTPTTGTQTIQNFDRRDVGISLKVTPQINESDFVTMDIEQSIESISGDASSGLASFDKRAAQTTVVVEDGQTVVIGGLISETENLTKRKVPILGDIPLLGWFFQNKNKTKIKQNLMIFITPSIIKSPEDMRDISSRKNIQRRRFNRKNRIDEPAGYRDYDIEKNLRINRRKDKKSQRKVGAEVREGEEASQATSIDNDTAAYRPGFVIGQQAEGDFNNPADDETSPFDEIVPPSSQ